MLYSRCKYSADRSNSVLVKNTHYQALNDNDPDFSSNKIFEVNHGSVMNTHWKFGWFIGLKVHLHMPSITACWFHFSVITKIQESKARMMCVSILVTPLAFDITFEWHTHITFLIKNDDSFKKTKFLKSFFQKKFGSVSPTDMILICLRRQEAKVLLSCRTCSNTRHHCESPTCILLSPNLRNTGDQPTDILSFSSWF